MSSETASVSYRDLFEVEECRAILLAHIASMLGSMIGGLAVTVLVYQRTQSPALTAAAFSLTFLPRYARSRFHWAPIGYSPGYSRGRAPVHPWQRRDPPRVPILANLLVPGGRCAAGVPFAAGCAGCECRLFRDFCGSAAFWNQRAYAPGSARLGRVEKRVTLWDVLAHRRTCQLLLIGWTAPFFAIAADAMAVPYVAGLGLSVRFVVGFAGSGRCGVGFAG